MKHAKCPLFSLLRSLLVWLSMRLVLQGTFNHESRPVNKSLLPKVILLSHSHSFYGLAPGARWKYVTAPGIKCQLLQRFLSLLHGGVVFKNGLFLFRSARGFCESKIVPQTSPLILHLRCPSRSRKASCTHTWLVWPHHVAAPALVELVTSF